MKSDTGSVTVLVPAYNAELTIEELINRIHGSADDAEIVVVDDGSTDRTREKARSCGAIVLGHENNRGKGAALQTGFDYIYTNASSEYIVTVDADLQHRPEEIRKFLEGLIGSHADLVIGWRKRIGTGMPVHRIVSNAVTSMLMSVRTGKKIKDSQCGFRMFRKDILKNIRLESEGYEAETEFLIKTAKQGYRIGFVPVETIYGDEKSHMTNWRTTVNFLRVMLRRYK